MFPHMNLLQCSLPCQTLNLVTAHELRIGTSFANKVVMPVFFPFFSFFCNAFGMQWWSLGWQKLLKPGCSIQKPRPPRYTAQPCRKTEGSRKANRKTQKVLRFHPPYRHQWLTQQSLSIWKRLIIFILFVHVITRKTKFPESRRCWQSCCCHAGYQHPARAAGFICASHAPRAEGRGLSSRHSREPGRRCYCPTADNISTSERSLSATTTTAVLPLRSVPACYPRFLSVWLESQAANSGGERTTQLS